MSKLLQLRTAAHEIFGAALRAVDPGASIRQNVRVEDCLVVCDKHFEFTSETNVHAIAIGKASERMAQAIEKVVGGQLVNGILSGPRRRSGWDYFAGGHPLPNEDSLAAAKAAIQLLELVDHENSLIVFLISGGGSAMFELPISKDITLEDLRAANEILVGCGASISEVNAVRRSFSAVKGGRLATFAPKSRQLTLIVSDVPAGEEHNVASGPTWTPPTGGPSAVEVVARYELENRLPGSIMRAIESGALPPNERESDRHKHFVLLDNDTALKAAANAASDRGFVTEIARDIADGPIDVGCEELLTRLNKLQSQNPDSTVCLISGGEFACPVRGDGIGGRNSETALRLALAVDKDPERYGDFAALCAGTDGLDGNSLIAGAIVDSTTIERGRSMALDASYFLDDSDAGRFLSALEDAIETGPTGTNVRDLRILMSTHTNAEGVHEL
jgi:glycerate 2-kinase